MIYNGRDKIGTPEQSEEVKEIMVKFDSDRASCHCWG